MISTPRPLQISVSLASSHMAAHMPSDYGSAPSTGHRAVIVNSDALEQEGTPLLDRVAASSPAKPRATSDSGGGDVCCRNSTAHVLQGTDFVANSPDLDSQYAWLVCAASFLVCSSSPLYLPWLVHQSSSPPSEPEPCIHSVPHAFD